ncbi:hypothetical protein [Taklimakanibacter lacteus]|uniref:hypothetical protein n=1 Tax=Taklimakanibacter lacteus TaxID=2268456 RepID=UPI0013C51099
MKIAMAPEELRTFSSFLSCSRRYVEFGSGGSTVLAAGHVAQSVIAFDSSREWLDRVANACREGRTRLTPELVFLDIGELGDWGFPKDESARARWPLYHSSMWSEPRYSAGDLYLIDGRFRVACFTQVLLHADDRALVAIHDYALRPHYHRVAALAREIIRVKDLSVFIRRADFNRKTALDLLDDHAYDPR